MSLKQAFDDREISSEQIAHWVIMAADRLNLLHTQKIDSGMLLTTFVVDIQQDGLRHRRYVELPTRIFDMDLDGAIRHMCYYMETDTDLDEPRFLQVLGYRTTPTQAHVMNGHPDQRASSREFQFFRDNPTRVYLIGVDDMITKMEIGLMVASPDIRSIVLTDEIRFPPETVLLLERHVLDLGRLALSLPGTKLANDGSERIEEQQPQPPIKAVSVNAPELNTDA